MSSGKSSTDSNSAHEESTPLYDSLELSEPGMHTLPPPTATPEDVRNYLSSLLKQRHSLAEEHARRVAARWILGTGHELRTYTPTMFLAIFGSEEGWMLYRDAKLQVYRTPAKKTFWQERGIYIVLGVACVVELVSVMILTHDASQGVKTVAAMFMGPGVFVCVGSVIALVVGNAWSLSPEQRIENELRACTWKSVPYCARGTHGE